MGKTKKWFLENLLTVLMISAVILGIIIGLIIKFSTTKVFTQREIMYIGFTGELFLQMLRCLVVPLIIVSLIHAIGHMDVKLSRKVGGISIAYYLSCSLLSSYLGVLLAVVIKPGYYAKESNVNAIVEQTVLIDTVLDLIRNLLPANLVGATIQIYKTKLTQMNPNETDIYKWNISESSLPIPNAMGIIIISLVVGTAVSILQSQLIISLFEQLAILVLKITDWIIWCAPVGIMFILISRLVGENIREFFGSLGIYCAVIIMGSIIHGGLVMPLIYYLITKKNPYIFMRNQAPALITALGTGSSAASLSINLACVEEKNKINPTIARFVLPIGATLNMNGTAIYEAVGALYISQARNRDLNIGDYIVVGIVALLASIGTAGIPNAGLVTMIMVLSSINLPPQDISLIIPVDWIVDHAVTVVNVLSDAYAAGIVAHLTKKIFTSDEN